MQRQREQQLRKGEVSNSEGGESESQDERETTSREKFERTNELYVLKSALNEANLTIEGLVLQQQ